MLSQKNAHITEYKTPKYLSPLTTSETVRMQRFILDERYVKRQLLSATGPYSRHILFRHEMEGYINVTDAICNQQVKSALPLNIPDPLPATTLINSGTPNN